MEVSELVPRPEWALPTSQETKVSCPDFGSTEEVSELVPRSDLDAKADKEVSQLINGLKPHIEFSIHISSKHDWKT